MFEDKVASERDRPTFPGAMFGHFAAPVTTNNFAASTIWPV